MADKRRVALITGAARGIGAAAARVFSERGWDVVCVDRSEIALGSGFKVRADVSRLEEVDRIVAEVRSNHQFLDALVNNAAEQIAKPVVETNAAEWDSVMSTNVRAVYLLSSRLHSLLRSAKGCIVNVGSVHAVATSSGMAAYVASKGAVVALTRALALEFAADEIRVNAVLPGAIDTAMLADGMKRSSGQTLQSLASKHPLGRVGTPQDVAEAIYFLADRERASFITGQTLIVDGGATARLSTES